VGRYTVAVEAVDLDATDAVVAANTFNDARENGRFATADAAAQGASVRVGDQLDVGSDPVVWAVP
jgi:hypothetical protein